MKKIIFTISALAMFLAVNAQNRISENWPNGNKKSEGGIIGNVLINASDSKEVQAQKMSSVVKDGKWTTWFENGKLHSDEYYSNGAMTGTWKTMYENGQTESTIDFTNGKEINYTVKGAVSSEGGIADGMVQKGKWTGYYEKGTKNYEGSYDNSGHKDGVWTWWNEKGEVSAEQTFKNGALINTRDLSKK